VATLQWRRWANIETQISTFNGGQGPKLLLGDGGDLTLLVHKGAEFEKAGKVPDPSTTKVEEMKVILGLLDKCQKADKARFTKMAKEIKVVSEVPPSTSTTRSPSPSSTTRTAAANPSGGQGRSGGGIRRPWARAARTRAAGLAREQSFRVDSAPCQDESRWHSVA
jgi:hypothetical protein